VRVCILAAAAFFLRHWFRCGRRPVWDLLLPPGAFLIRRRAVQSGVHLHIGAAHRMVFFSFHSSLKSSGSMRRNSSVEAFLSTRGTPWFILFAA
jgi:hypothetical protein